MANHPSRTPEIHEQGAVALLLSLTGALNAATTEGAMVRALAEHAQALCQAEWAEVGRPRGDEMVLEVINHEGTWEQLDYVLPRSGSIAGHVCVTKQPYFSNDLARDPHTDRAEDEQWAFHNQLSVPLLGEDGGLLAVVTLYNTPEARPFTAEDVRLLSAMAAQAAVALERARASAALVEATAALQQREARYREAYARSTDGKHWPAWVAFNKRTGKSRGDVGIWHETYRVRAGEYETIYSGMPPVGLGKVGALVTATGRREAARGRMGLPTSRAVEGD